MRILLIEDDDDKRRRLCEFLTERVASSDLVEARSVNSGLKQIRSSTFDVVLLDMTMPSYDISVDEDGGRPQAFGGREILLHMQEYDVTSPAIVVTQFEQFGDDRESMTLEELDQRLREVSSYKGAVYYNAASDAWKEALIELIDTVTQRQ